MVRTRSTRAKLAEEGVPLSPSQSLPNEPRRREPAAKKKKKNRCHPSSPPAEDTSETQPQITPEPTPDPTQGPTNDPEQDLTQDSTSPPAEELLEAKLTRRQTSKYTTSETQTQNRSYRTGAKKRKREEGPTIESILEAKIQKDREDRHYLRSHPTPSDTDRQRLRQARIDETENILQECRDSRANEPRRKRTCTKLVPDLYDEEGNLRLGRYKKVEFEVDDGPEIEQGPTDTQEQTFGNSLTENNLPRQHEPASTNYVAPLATEMTDKASKLIEITEDPYNDSEIPYINVPLEESFQEEQLQTQTHAEPETPRARSWGFTNIIPSSIAKLIPFSSHRTPPANTPPPLAPSQPLAPSERQVLDGPKTPARSNYRKHFLDDNRIHFFDETSPQRERSTRNTRSNLRVHFASHPPAADSTPRPQVAQPGESQKSKERLEQELRAKIEAEYKAKALEESEKLTAALKKKVDEVDKRDKRIERERKKIAQHLDEIIPGSKRKRMPSPEVIPNPAGGGFGMDLDYFYISDLDSDEEDETPVRKPQTKKARTSSPEAELIGGSTANNATPTRRHQTMTARTSSPEAELLGVSTGNNATPMRRRQTMTARTSSHEAELLGGSTANDETPLPRHQTMRARTSSPEAELHGGSTGNDETPIPRHRTMRARTSSPEAELHGGSTGNGEASSMSQIGSQMIATSPSFTDVNMSSPRNIFEISLSPQTTPEYAPGPTMTFKVPSPTSSDDDSELDLQSQQGDASLLSPLASKSLDLQPQQSDASPLSPLASKSLAPKQHPAPNYTAIPTPSHLVEKARQKALMHQPKTGSNLRNASRLSSSTAGSGPVEEQSKAEDSAECEEIYEDFLNTHSNSFQEFLKGVSPKVTALMNATWTEQDNIAAEKAFASGMEDFDEAQVEEWMNEGFEAWKAGQLAGAAA